MKDAEEWDEEEEGEASGEGRSYRGRSYGRYGGYAGGRSYRRGRNSMGRYTSRDMWPEDASGRWANMYPRYPSYDDGYRY